MDKLAVTPGVGIGIFKFGMTKEEVHQCIEYYETKYYDKKYGKNYFRDVFRVQYDDNGAVNFIELPDVAKNIFICEYNNIDLFNTKSKELIEKLQKISDYDSNNPELGWSYNFPKLGLNLWRASILNEEDLDSEWFNNLSKENQDDELRYLYFESVALYI